MQEISEDTVARASQGDLDAFEAIYRVYSPFVYNVVLRVVNDGNDAEEVTQDVFLTLYRKLSSFRFKSSLKTWIYRIAVNSAINRAKKGSRERERTVEYVDDVEFSPTVNPLEEKMDREHRDKIVSKLLAALNPDQRACLVLRDLEGLSYKEIAKTLKVKVNTVRSRLKRAREKLLVLTKEGATNEV